jgi:hypothetical protein
MPRSNSQANKIDFRRHIWLDVADKATTSPVRATFWHVFSAVSAWTGFESSTGVCQQGIDE